MSRDIVYFDLETQRTANDVGGWGRKRDMGMSIGVTYSTRLGEYRIYSEKDVLALVDQLVRADLVVGFNVINFDYEVLMGYTVLDLPHQCRTLDMLVEVEKTLGHRLSLDAIATATLGVGKTAEGLDAIRWWREGRLLEIAEYCCFDVKCTRLVHEHGLAHGELHYTDKFKKKLRVAVDWSAAN
ncbi:MAG: ribonuclease H-like domain-containing protein [Chthoniobacteraceae bacterium]